MFRSTPILLLGVSLGLATGCASRLSGDVRYDHETDFSAVKTFAFERGLEAIPEARRANVAKARSATESGLVAKGYRFVAREDADLLVRVITGRRGKTSVSGPAGWGTYAGLQIEMRRPDGSFVWEGWAAETWQEGMDPSTEIDKAVALVLEQFPPS